MHFAKRSPAYGVLHLGVRTCKNLYHGRQAGGHILGGADLAVSPGGVAMTTVSQPAMPAGTAIMSMLEGSTPVPPGT